MTITLTELIILILAAFRLSALLTFDRGPFDIFVKIRELSGIKYIETEKDVQPIVIIPDRFFAGLLSCFGCISTWVAMFVWLLWFSNWYIIDAGLLVLAIAGGLYLIHKVITR